MEKRRHTRIRVNLQAERVSGNGNHSVFIENISECGILMITPHSGEIKKFAVGTDIDLRFRLSTGRTIGLTCRVRWSFEKTPPDGLTDSIGLQIIDPPPLYREFISTLH